SSRSSSLLVSSGYFPLEWEKTGRIRILRYRESAYRSCERLAGFCGRGRRAEKNTVGRTDNQTETPEREPRGAGMYRDCRTQTAISVLPYSGTEAVPDADSHAG